MGFLILLGNYFMPQLSLEICGPLPVLCYNESSILSFPYCICFQVGIIFQKIKMPIKPIEKKSINRKTFLEIFPDPSVGSKLDGYVFFGGNGKSIDSTDKLDELLNVSGGHVINLDAIKVSFLIPMDSDKRIMKIKYKDKSIYIEGKKVAK